MFGFMDYLPESITTALAVVAGIGLVWWVLSAYNLSAHHAQRQSVTACLREENIRLGRIVQELKEHTDSWESEFTAALPPEHRKPETQETAGG